MNHRLILSTLALTCLMGPAPSQSASNASRGQALTSVNSTVSSSSQSVGCPEILSQWNNQSGGLFSDMDCDACPGTGAQSMAADVVLNSPVKLCTLKFWGGYFPTNTPIADNFTLRISGDAAGLPGALVYAESGLSPFRGLTGGSFNGVAEYEYDLFVNAPIELFAGTYHIELFNDTTGSTESWVWERGNLDASRGIAGASVSSSAPGTAWSRYPFIDLGIVMTESGFPPNIPGSPYCFGDGTGATCPCSAFGGPGEGCMNSGGSGALLEGLGMSNLGFDTFKLKISGVPGDKPGLIVRGDNQIANPVGDGLRCTSGGTQRSQVQITQAGTTFFTHFQNNPFGSVANVGAPTNFQFWYRDPAGNCSGSDFNFSNAWTATVFP